MAGTGYFLLHDNISNKQETSGAGRPIEDVRLAIQLLSGQTGQVFLLDLAIWCHT